MTIYVTDIICTCYDTLYHRAIATDGSLSSAGEGKSVNITLGLLVTDVDDAVIQAMSFVTFPNPTQDNVVMNITSVENLDATLMVVDQLGRVLEQRATRLFVGENRENINLESAQDGVYFVQLFVENKLVGTERILIQK